MSEVIEIDTTFDPRGRYGTKQDSDWTRGYRHSCLTGGDSSKIIPDSKEWVPYFSIGHDESLDSLNTYHRGGYWWTNGCGKYFAQREAIPKDWQNPIENLDKIGLPEPVLAIAIDAIQKLWNDTVRRGHGSYSSRNDVLDKLSLKDLKKLIIYYIRKERDKVERYIADSTLDLDEAWEGTTSNWNSMWKWGDFFNTFWSVGGFVMKRARMRTPGYVVGNGYIARYDSETGLTEPLVCLMVKKSYFPYYKGSLLVGDRVDSKYFKLYVKEGLDIKDTSDKALRPKYRKYIKKVLAEAGVEIVEKKTLNDIFAVYKLPAMKSLGEYEKFLEDASIEVMDYCRDENIITY
jgi:hypothetical protein